METGMTIVPRSEEILDPEMSIIQRIGRMARICYKVEGEARYDVDCRIIKNCIKEGHESILEHGIISVFINPTESQDSKDFAHHVLHSKDPISFEIPWMLGATDAQNKYIEKFNDPDLYEKFKIANKFNGNDRRVLPCKVGDVRAWRQLIRERIFLSTQSRDVGQYIFTLKILNELDKVDNGAHILFGDIVDDMNETLKDENVRRNMLPKECVIPITTDGCKEGEQYTVRSVSDYYFKIPNTIFAGEAASCASMSVIITTDRAMTHQLVRHRKNVGYSQESQRYVNYGKKGCRAIALTVDPLKVPKDLKVLANGEVEQNQEVYTVWNNAIKTAFENYTKLLDLGLPPESARGVLPNDTATTIGVTWMRPAAYINLNYWRLDGHAQFTIRATLFRIMLEAFKKRHPFMETIPHNISMRWLQQMIDQKILGDSSPIEKLMKLREAMHQKVLEMLKQHNEEQAQALANAAKK